MNDPFESSLRASLQSLGVAHDDVRADRMISVATAGDPLSERRHVLAPLAAAAAVVAVGATVAVVAQHGHDPAPSGNLVGAPTTSTRPALPENLDVTAVYSASAAPGGRTVHHTYGVVYSPQGSDELPNAPIWLTLENMTVDKVTITDSHGDRAGFRLVSGTKVLVDTSVSGRRTTVTIPSTRAADLAPVVQCREPGRGPTCRLMFEFHGVVHRPFDTSTHPTGSNPPYVATPRRTPSTTAPDGTASRTTTSRTTTSRTTSPTGSSSGVYEPPAPPSCPTCQVP